MQETFSVPLPPCCYSYFSAERRFAALIGSQSTASIGLQRGGQIIRTLSKANLLLLFDSSHFLYALTWSSFSLQQAKCLRSIVTVPLLRSGQADTLASHVRGTGPFVKDRWCSPEWCAPSQGQNIRNSRLYSDSSRNPCEDEQCSAVHPMSRRAAVVPCQLRRKGWTGMLNPEPRVKLPRCLINPDLHSLICVRKGPVFHAATPLSGNQQSTEAGVQSGLRCTALVWGAWSKKLLQVPADGMGSKQNLQVLVAQKMEAQGKKILFISTMEFLK